MFVLNDAIATGMSSVAPRSSLGFAAFAPALGADVGADADTDAPGALVAAWSPGPAGASSDGQMVEAEAKPGASDANQSTEEQIESEMAEVGKASAGDVNGRCDGDQD